MLIVTRCVDISGIVYGECVRHKIQKSKITYSLSISYATTLNTFVCFPVAKIRDFGEKCEVKVKNKKFPILRVHLCNLDHRCI